MSRARSPRPPKAPPRWLARAAWRVHRLLHRASGGRMLWTPESRRGGGVMRMTVPGRRSGQMRVVLLEYILDGEDAVALAMNGWGEGHPQWWRNVLAHPDVEVRMAGRPAVAMRAHEALGDERARLWGRWQRVEPQLDGYAALRRTPTPVVVFSPG